jgi:predicted GIY-YIG superfamily endonuclease
MKLLNSDLELRELVELPSITGASGGSIPPKPVIYFVSHDNELQYVGQTSNLQLRMRQHWRDGRFPPYGELRSSNDTRWVLFWQEENDKILRLRYETAYIALLRPILNKAILLRLYDKGRKVTEIRWRRPGARARSQKKT